MTRTLTVSLAVALALATTRLVVFSESVALWAGTWKLNVAKSKYSPGPAPKNQLTRIEATANGLKGVTDTVDANGVHQTQTIDALFDGKEYEFKGGATRTTWTLKRIDNRRYDYVTRVDGKIATTSRVVVTADGKTRTITTIGTDAQGRSVSNVRVWDRQ